MPTTEITNWFTVTPATVCSERQNYITIPDFSYTGLTWLGASEIIVQFNFTVDENFCILVLPSKPSNANFVPCIRYRVGETVYRYKLWNDDNLVLGDVSLYNGELIKPNFVIEIWNLSDETSVSLAADINILTSIKTTPTDLRVRTSLTQSETESANQTQLGWPSPGSDFYVPLNFGSSSPWLDNS